MKNHRALINKILSQWQSQNRCDEHKNEGMLNLTNEDIVDIIDALRNDA